MELKHRPKLCHRMLCATAVHSFNDGHTHRYARPVRRNACDIFRTASARSRQSHVHGEQRCTKYLLNGLPFHMSQQSCLSAAILAVRRWNCFWRFSSCWFLRGTTRGFGKKASTTRSRRRKPSSSAVPYVDAQDRIDHGTDCQGEAREVVPARLQLREAVRAGHALEQATRLDHLTRDHACLVKAAS